MKKIIYILIIGIFTSCELDEVNYLDDCGIVIESTECGYGGVYRLTLQYPNGDKSCIYIADTDKQIGDTICNTF